MAIYYAHKAGNINADDVWYDDPSAGSGVTGATALAGTHTLRANGYAVAVNVDFTAAQIDTLTSGGSFTIATGSDRVISADILGGTSHCLVCSHASPYRVTVNCQSTNGVKGGGTSNYSAITSSGTGKITINAYSSNANAALTGGSASTAAYALNVGGASAEIVINGGVIANHSYALYINAAANPITINGNVTGGAKQGAAAIYVNGGATLTVSDGYTITAGSVGTYTPGIQNNGTGSSITIGQCHLVNTVYGSAIAGACKYNPTNTNYAEYPKTTGTVKLAAEPAATDIKKDVVVGTVTGTYEGAGGGSGIIRSNLNRAGVIQ